ncbi:winged helix-turn-helix domain-containing protein [Halocatena halophila]|uniref:winged helix-turn-helix domain-containing protein n=1 Tax=Halocatena halophila TaxID=2814576 RepID=UPI002ED4BCBA
MPHHRTSFDRYTTLHCPSVTDSDSEILDLLSDEYAQMILQQTHDEPLSASELSDRCGISISTVYRRTERLVACGLLADRQIAQSDGSHYTIYQAQLDELTVRLTEDGLTVPTIKKQAVDLADRFTDLWGRL